MNPTTEQQANIEAICNIGGPNLLISACAGGAKTTTLKLGARALSERGFTAPALAIAFNKRNAEDLAKVMPSNFVCKTFNSIGHSAWAKTCGRRLTLDTRKLGDIVSALVKGKPESALWADILSVARQARVNSLVPKSRAASRTWGTIETESLWTDCFDDADVEPSEDVFMLARATLEECIRQSFAGVIDFDDQIYMSTCFGGAFNRFDLVLVDEAQDLSGANHRMVKLSTKRRVIAVGDRYQAIYGFRGASHNSMDELKAEFKMVETHLNTTFRCARAIVGEAQKRNPAMVPFETNPAGVVEHWAEWSAASIPHHCAILCRNNAPLLGIAFKLIRAGRGVNFLGGDLSKGLNKILDTFGDASTPSEMAMTALHHWKSSEQTKATARGADHLLARIEDKFECCLVALENSTNLGEAKNWLKRIFSEEAGPITLSTGHKSKGFEWDTAIILDPWRIPSAYAKRAAESGDRAQLEQEFNLRYVMQTRAKLRLIYANKEKFQ